MKNQGLCTYVGVGMLVAAVVFGGLSQLVSGFGMALVVLACMWLCWQHRGYLVVKKDWILVGPGLMLLGALIATIATPAHGMGFLGIMRLLAVALFVLLLWQVPTESIPRIWSWMPLLGTILVLFCAICFFIPGLRDEMYVAGRLSGTFHYANVCGLFLLFGLVALLMEEPLFHSRILFDFQLICLLLGILWTGARTVFVLTILSLGYAVLQKVHRREVLLLGGSVLAATCGYVLVTGNMDSIGRFMTTSLHSATLAERVICWRDGFSVLLAHPLGLGYKGFAMLENAIQTGPYSVQYVHNDWLQMALDYGVIGGIGFLVFYGMAMVRTRGWRRWLLVILAINLFFEFSLQFQMMVWLLLLLLPWQETGEERRLSLPPLARCGALVVLMALFFWIGLADGMTQVKDYKASMTIYPWNWQVRMFDLTADMTQETIPERVEVLLQQNPWNPTAYNAWSIYYQRNQNYFLAINKGRAAVKLHTYDMASYDNLILFYGQAIEKSRADGNEKLVTKWTKELQEVYNQWVELQECQDALSRQIARKDAYQLNERSLEILNYYQIK